jgi:hypothetical protein
MTKRGASKRATFAEIVAEFEATPKPDVASLEVAPGKFSGDILFDLAGNRLTAVEGSTLELDEVRAAVLGGAAVAWDACGCGGYCNTLE